MKVSEVMQTEFSSLRSDQTLAEVIRAFAKHKITSAPVFSGSKFVGMISDADIAKYLLDAANASAKGPLKPKNERERKTPVAKTRRITAGALAKMPRVTLSPDKPILYALSEVARRIDCIPVVDGDKFEGVLRADDIIRFFLRELAKEDAKAEVPAKIPSSFGELGRKIDTDMDRILSIVRRDGEASCEKIAGELGLPVQAAEKLCESLANHQLVEMRYAFLGGATVRGIAEKK